MKNIQGIGYFILIIFSAALLAAVFAPSRKEIKRSITINQSAAQIFGQIAEFRNWKNWDAWFQRDTTQERVYSGKRGDESQAYMWCSTHKNVGKGRMRMISINENEKMEYRFYFDKGIGQEDSADGCFTITESNGTSKVTWTMVSTMGYPWKIFNYFIEGMVAPDFEEGLARLKSYTENLSDESATSILLADVKIISEFGINYAAVKAETLPTDESTDFFSQGYQKIYRYIESNGMLAKGSARGLIYNWDEMNQQTSLAAAVPISDILDVESEGILLESDSAELSVDQISAISVGGYADSYKVHTALYEWLEKNEKEIKFPVVEEYVVGPQQTEDSTAFVTKIIYHF